MENSVTETTEEDVVRNHLHMLFASSSAGDNSIPAPSRKRAREMQQRAPRLRMVSAGNNGVGKLCTQAVDRY